MRGIAAIALLGIGCWAIAGNVIADTFTIAVVTVKADEDEKSKPAESKPADGAKKPSFKLFADAAAKAGPPAPHIFSIHEEDIAAQPLSISGGKLALKTEPPRELPLDELAKVDFANAPVLTARWLGQDNHDLAQAKNLEGASGIQDLHVQLMGLVRNRPIKQVVLGEGLYLWKSDTTSASNWKLVVERTDGSGVADLYAEPPKVDRNGSEFKVTIIYEDGSKVHATVKATSPTDNTLKVVASDGKAAVPAAGGPLVVLAQFEDGSELSGQLDGLSKETLRLAIGGQPAIEIPLLRLRSLWLESAGDAKSRKQFQERVKSPGAEDSAFVRSSTDQTVTEITGQTEELREGKLRFTFEGQTRSINLARLVGIVFAKHPAAAATDQPYQLFQLASGDRIAGSWTGLADGVVTCELPWGAKLSLPTKEITAVEFRNGKLVYLSDLEPTTSEEVAYFGRPIPHARDKTLLGEPLKLAGKGLSQGDCGSRADRTHLLHW